MYRRLRGGTVALRGLDLEVPEGGVFGFLGPNAAGKTTTIRCLLGLVRSDGGTARLLGADVSKDLAKVVQRVGSVVETPAFFPRFSGRRNPRLLARIRGIGFERVDAVLERVGLAERSGSLVKSYSFGMKQRLGIAAALLGDPEVLVLDEPANGLDPAGIVEVRDLLRSFGRAGRTVFVSSHILSEVEQMADRVAILAHGECLTTGRVEEVLSSGRSRGMIARLDDLGAGERALAEAGIHTTPAHGALRVELPPTEAATVTRVLGSRSVPHRPPAR